MCRLSPTNCYISRFLVNGRSHKARGQRSAPEPFHVEHGANATDDAALSDFSSAVCRATGTASDANAAVRDATNHGFGRNAVEVSNCYWGK